MSFGVVCCCGSYLTIFVFGTATVRVTVFVSGFAIFLASAMMAMLSAVGMPGAASAAGGGNVTLLKN
jgi:hypothetical protein